MAEAAVSIAIVLIKAVPLLHKIYDDYDPGNIQTVSKWLNTMMAYLKDTERREETEGWKDRVKQVQDQACDAQDAIQEFMFHASAVNCRDPDFFEGYRGTLLRLKYRPQLKKFSSRMKAIKDQVKNIKDFDPFRIIPSKASSSSITSREVPSMELHHIVPVYVEKIKNKLHDLVFREESRMVVISVIGYPGSGKTTLIKEFYKTKKKKFESYDFVTVPRSFERLKNEIQRSLSHLQHKKFILVVDGIWERKEWNCIKSKLPCNNKGSRVIISTSNRDLGSYCATSLGSIYDHSRNPLSQKAAWELFCVTTFHTRKCPDVLEKCSKKIVGICEKSPHAIVAVGNYLSKQTLELIEFKGVHDRLQYDPEHTVSRSYYGIFSCSYYHLLPILKSCFLYFCNFPGDCSVKRGKLIHLWIAEGFTEVKERKTPEQAASDYLNELVKRSLVQVTKYDCQGRVRKCRVSNVARGFILSILEKSNFLTVVSRPSHTNLGGKETRRLSLQNCFPPNLQEKNLSYVRTFSVFKGKKIFKSMNEKLFSKFKLLTVLDLENSGLQLFPENVVNLVLLRYLCLRNTNIDSVPKSIKKLQNLMILDLRQTSITNLPEEIHKLCKLYSFRVSCRDRENSGAQVWPVIGCMTSLQELSLIKANYEGKSIVKELGNLTQLRKLWITELDRKDKNDFCASIENIKGLTSLYVNSASKREYLDLDFKIKPPKQLRSVFLEGRLKKIPAWICKLNCLFKLKLKGSKLEKYPLEDLQALPSLKELLLYDAYIGLELKFRAESFLKLRILEIEQCSQLETIKIRERAMPKLRKLTIKKCCILAKVYVTKKFHHQLEEKNVPKKLICFLS